MSHSIPRSASGPARGAGRLAACLCLSALLVASSCGSPNEPSPPPPPPTLTLTCPAGVEAQSLDGNPLPVQFEAPRAAGGTAPVTISCSHNPGANFAIGATSVLCSASDARGATAFCSFSVTVRAPPRLAVTRFLAFGDSITAGTDSPPAPGASIIVSPYAYPVLLDPLLRGRYRLQNPVILAEGIPGEKASEGGIARFRSVVRQLRPEAVILMEGTNDLLDFQIGVQRAAEALRLMVQQAKLENARVLLSTVIPQRAGGSRSPPRDPYAALVPQLNDRIREIAQAENVPLVDMYAVFQRDMTLIGVDDVHPTPRGFQVMAETFFEAIRTHFEVVP
jgi:lysophospholipase L1-like esterase